MYVYDNIITTATTYEREVLIMKEAKDIIIDERMIKAGKDTLKIILIETSFEETNQKQRCIRIESNINGERHSEKISSLHQNIYGIDLMKELPADEAKLLNSIMAMYIIAGIGREFPIYTPINMYIQYKSFVDKVISGGVENY